jgi:mono/diheme cytochrome c family protein
VTRWIVPAAVLIPVTLLWYLAAAKDAGVAVAETLGARGGEAGALLSAVFSSSAGGHPIVRHAAAVTVVGAAVLVLGALLLAGLRARTYGRLAASALMVAGFVSMGASEWVREGLRKPWVVDRYMFVNSIRVPLSVDGAVVEDPFTVEALSARGVLATARFTRLPGEGPPGIPPLDDLDPSARAAVLAEAGGEVFRLECAACHTASGHLGIRRLVAGQGVAALEATLDSLASPVTGAGEPTTWADPHVGVTTRLGRRMPPFVGTDLEKHALAVHLARLGGDPEAGVALASGSDLGAETFETYCAACHGPESPWPIAERLGGRSAEELHDLLGRLNEVQEDMPPFAGTEEERAALSEHLAGLPAASSEEEVIS